MSNQESQANPLNSKETGSRNNSFNTATRDQLQQLQSHKPKAKESVAVAVSGGVDSMVTAMLLKERGHQVTAVHLILRPDHPPEADDHIPQLAARLEVPLQVVDLRKPFHETVVKPFLEAYRRGRTPNPCVICNPRIKFTLLQEHAMKLGVKTVATGHYARLLTDDSDGSGHLFLGGDRGKDQSYFLHGLSQEQLRRTSFPLGDYLKSEVKQLAAAAGMSEFHRPESQEICFISDDDYRNFLEEHLGSDRPQPGPILDMKGQQVGEHGGIHRYTIGQRRGIGIPSTAPYYVVALEPDTNTVRVGRESDVKNRELIVTGVNWIAISPPTSELKALVQVRSRHRMAPALLMPATEGVLVRFVDKQKAITPGQSAVFYSGDEVLGGWHNRAGALMKTVALATLGCKVNQCESAYLEEKLAQEDFLIRPFSEETDLYCINTCAVTGRAAMQSRQLIRRAVRLNPQATVVVMGCYSQIAAEEIAAIPGVTHILGTTEKLELLDYLSHSQEIQPPCIHLKDAREAPTPTPLVFSNFANRTRAFLKIQDGCDAFCSYCIVPYARGRSRSITLESILHQVKRFLDNGYQEIVLTGIHLGQWGPDLEPEQDLTTLLRSILRHCPPPRLRLSSLEPREITPDLLQMIDEESVLCPHLHIPLQSGDATILSRMNRHYHPDSYRDLVLEATHRIPDLAVGVDVLVGFPGETDECFHNTYRLIEALPVAYLHIFPYSSRPNTPAANMREQVAAEVIRQRCKLLAELDKAKRLLFLQRFLGKMRPVLVENRRDESTGMLCGFSDNYLPALVQADLALENQVVMARLDRLEGNRLLAIPV